MIESGWHLSRCGQLVDRCVEAPFHDEMVSNLLTRSILPAVRGENLFLAPTVGTLHTFDALHELAADLPNNGQSDLIMAHSFAPHPPMRLDAKCAIRAGTPDRSGPSLFWTDIPPELLQARMQTFLEQLACVDSMVGEFVERIPRHDFVLIVGDHGSDAQGQLNASLDHWTPEMVRERMFTLAALRVGDCDAQLTQTILAVPRLLSCLGFDVSHGPAGHAYVVQEDAAGPIVVQIPHHLLGPEMDLADVSGLLAPSDLPVTSKRGASLRRNGYPLPDVDPQGSSAGVLSFRPARHQRGR